MPSIPMHMHMYMPTSEHMPTHLPVPLSKRRVNPSIQAEKIQPAPTEEPLLLEPSADLTPMSPSSSNNAAQVEVHVADEIAHV